MYTIESLHEAYVTGQTSVEKEVMTRVQKAKQNSCNSCLEVLSSSALVQAKKADEQMYRNTTSLLLGIPFGVKDCFLVAGTKTTGGSALLGSYDAPYTSSVVQRLCDAGAVLIAKENLDQFGHGSTGENSSFGPTKNARDQTKVAGGSSAGSAVNVADDITVFSLGEDTGGSIRQPAGYNRVVGFKPSYGKVSRNGVISYASSLDTIGPITKSVRDAAIVMNIIGGTGPNTYDMTTTPYTSLSLDTLDDLDFKKMRIGRYTPFLTYSGIDPEIKDATFHVIDYCKQQGATIHELDFFPGELLVATYYVLAMAETASELARLDGVRYGKRSEHIQTRQDIYLHSRGEGFSEETKKRIVIGNQILSTGFADHYYTKALLARKKLQTHFSENFREVDFIISPVTPNKVPSLGEQCDDQVAMYMSDLYTVGFSLGGLPTLSVPLASPAGIQITGAYDNDANVLRLGHMLEQKFPTIGRQ